TRSAIRRSDDPIRRPRRVAPRDRGGRMTELTAQRVAELSGGRLIGDGDRTASSIVFNHKELRPGAAFAAVGRGYDFIAQALADGAPFAIAEKPAEGNVIVVDDTVLALGRVAKAVRRELDVRV